MNNLPELGIGIMSGSSTDGLDLALLQFRGLPSFIENGTKVEWSLLYTQTVPFSNDIRTILTEHDRISLNEFLDRQTDVDRWLTEQTEDFLKEIDSIPGYIALHGHTLRHSPDNGYSLQIPSGNRLSAQTKLPVISDFRQTDIALGGQGTPVAPIADRDLFPNYDAWLNIGGIANCSYREGKKMRAYDVCPANQLLNHLARKTDRPFDRNGALAREGTIIPDVLDALNDHAYYEKQPPKSLDNSYIQKSYFPIIEEGSHRIQDLLATCVEHIAEHITNACQNATGKDTRILVSGGGAHNGFLIDRLRTLSRGRLHYHIPEPEIVDYKECLLIAWAGLLRLFGRQNILSSVTGAEYSTSGGAVYDAHGKCTVWTNNNA